LDASQITTGILPVANGGTGKDTWSGLVYGSGATLSDIGDGTAGQYFRMVGTTPGWQTISIVDADVNTAAAIAGTKINPDFGDQNITTTGSLKAGTSTTFGSAALTWPAANAAGTLTNDGTGTLSWGASGLTNPMTTIGDIIYGGAAGTPTRLAAGTAGQVLTSNGAAAPTWTSIGSATGWTTAGNIALATDYIGTNNNIALNIRVNSTESGIIDPANLNTAFGQNSSSSLIAGGLNNTSFGYRSLTANTTGDENTAIGYNALQSNTTSNYNTAVGKSALFTQGGTNVNGSNTAIGYHTLYENTTGYFNTSMGYLAGAGGGSVVGNTTGNSNTYIGANSGPTANNFSNATTLGAGATVNASNKIRLGNTAVTVIEGQVSFSNTSDRRFKQNIKEIEYGLDFIKELKPVSYNMKSQDDRLNWGFIAQDVEKLVGTSNAVLTVGEDSLRTLSLRYTDFIAPMVKAMQEQQQEIEQLQATLKQKNDELTTLESSVTAMKNELEEIKKILGVEAKAKSTDKKLK
jgi:hypothetical protein